MNLHNRAKGSKSELKIIIAQEMRKLGEKNPIPDKSYQYALENYNYLGDHVNNTKALKAKLPAK